jgi:subtilase family serine protease
MNAYISGNAYIGKNQNYKTKIQQTSKFSADPQNLITKKNKQTYYYENKFIPCQNSINENKQNLKCRAYKPLKVHI